jgi:hypothetical protein
LGIFLSMSTSACGILVPEPRSFALFRHTSHLITFISLLMVSVAVPRGDEIQPLTARGKMMHLVKTTLLCAALAASAVTAFNAYGGSSSTTRRAFVSESTAAAAAAIVALPRAGVADDTADPYVDYITSESGMKYLITKEGDGAVPSAGQNVKVCYPFVLLVVS